MSAASDADLVARSGAGDSEAFRELFDRKHRRIYLIAYQILADAGQSEDVVQEVFLRLWQRCAAYDASFSVDAWLRRIATNRAIDFWRARNVERKYVAEAPPHGDGGEPLAGAAAAPGSAAAGATNPEVRLGWQQLQAIWDELAGDLPPQQRAAFVLRHIEGLPPAEVAAALDCSPSTVRSHVAEARRSLRRLLRARYPELVDDG